MEAQAEVPSGRQSRDLDAVLLETAAALFGRFGYAEVSVDRIAAEAAAGKQSIYRRFPTKEALFKAAVGAIYIAPVAAAWRAEVEAMERLQKTSGSSPLEGLRTLCGRALAFVARPDALMVYRLLVTEGWRFPDWTAIVVDGGAECERLIRIQLSLAQDAGEIGRCDLTLTARAVSGLLTGWVLRQGLSSDGPALRPDEIARHLDAAWRLLMEGLRTPAAHGAGYGPEDLALPPAA